ncbi:MAG: YeeE/YedE thiosulfate transporter family protein [Geminicoccaceae bacterium]
MGALTDLLFRAGDVWWVDRRDCSRHIVDGIARRRWLSRSGSVGSRARQFRRPFALAGGLIFGVGMVLAGGCASRSLVRLASGSAKSLLVVLLMGVFASATITGPVSRFLAQLASWRPEWPDPFANDRWDRGRRPVGGHPRAFIASGGRRARRNARELTLGAALGGICAAAWVVSSVFVDPKLPRSVDFLVPGADLLALFTTGRQPVSLFASALVGGTILGAFASSFANGSFAIETFSDSGDMKRHVVGGVAMGIGGGLSNWLSAVPSGSRGSADCRRLPWPWSALSPA